MLRLLLSLSLNLSLLLSLSLLLCLSLSLAISAQQNPLTEIIEQHRADFGPWVDHPDSFQVQVLYTQIDRDAEGEIGLTTHRWGMADTNQYFYPASTVKMPTAALALQKLNELGVLGLNARTPMYSGKGTAPASAPQTTVRADTSSQTGLPSIAHYIRKIFLVSDNDAYNRLFEWLGPTYLNKGLKQAGIHGARLQHRVGVGGFNDTTHAHLNPVRFADGFRTLYQIGERHDTYYDPLPGLGGQQRGVGFMRDGELVNEPFDFSHKNYLGVRNLHDILLRIVLPEAVPEAQRFQLTEEDYELLRGPMRQRPHESDYPRYATEADNYAKFWIVGDQGEDHRIPDELRILNKAGWAYGYITDAAYVTDGEVEFILVGAIHTNANRIYNDGEYEVEEVAMPFFGQLGRAILDWERRGRSYD